MSRQLISLIENVEIDWFTINWAMLYIKYMNIKCIEWA